MIKVAFIGTVSKEWMGGLNYFKNLLFALSTLKNEDIEVFVFVGKNTDADIKNIFRKFATIIEESIFDRRSFDWFLWRLENKFLKTNFILENILKKHNIHLLSHSDEVNFKLIKTINWIPDFQHLHLPDMFSSKVVNYRNKYITNLIKKSDKIILSSYDAFADFKTFAPDYLEKVEILQFVSQPEVKYFDLTQEEEIIIRKKYNIKENFFYIPNQFWKHKNHMLVFEAVKALVEKEINICIVCTGFLEDYRNKNYIEEIRFFIQKNNLENNIKLLGLVDYSEVFSLIKFSKAVINPSLFEGWSSTVEECKSVKKNMILSDLAVHKEQYPEATFFQRYNLESLCNILINYEVNEINEIESLKFRTEKFAQKYVTVVKALYD
jgi:glycosyltransferase involved in cell wall biosynthesis